MILILKTVIKNSSYWKRILILIESIYLCFFLFASNILYINLHTYRSLIERRQIGPSQKAKEHTIRFVLTIAFEFI